jgi:outer membrane protein assembly factor BamB
MRNNETGRDSPSNRKYIYQYTSKSKMATRIITIVLTAGIAFAMYGDSFNIVEAAGIQSSPSSSSTLYPSGDAGIDQVRRELSADPTDAGNYRERALSLFLWLGALQQQGADTSPFFELDEEYHRLETVVNRAGKGEQSQSLVAQLCTVIDRGYGVMAQIQEKLVEEGPIAKPYEAKAGNIPTGGDSDADWPMFQGNGNNTGYTEAPGPRYGRNAWKFPVGLGWYARPVVEDDRVYVSSPGMQTISYCLDLATGEEIWTAGQLHPIMGIYKYPVIASSPLVLKDKIILRETNSHGGNTGQAKNIVYVDKKTGEVLSREYAGHVDYRIRYAAVAGNEKYVVYPFGVHDIYSTPGICQNFNRLICRATAGNKILWDFNVGDIDALAEPVLTEERVIVGTMEGYLYALQLKGGNVQQRIAWNFRTEGSVNTQVAVDEGRVYFGANGGSVYCLDEATGRKIWQTRMTTVEPGARKHFSTPMVVDGKVYVGAANRRFYCLDAQTGDVLWEYEVEDWIRSRPVVTAEGVYAATVNGKLYCFSKTGKLQWIKVVSPHPIYADLTAAGDRLLLTDSNLYLYCMSPDGELAWRKSVLNCFYKDGERIFTDQLSGGTYYQSKPTAYQGKIYFGNPAGFLYAVDAESGREVWKFEMGAAISVGPAIVDGKVYAGQQGGERFFYCLDADDGSLRWKQTIPGGWVWGSAAVDEEQVYVPTVDGYAVCLDRETGHIRWMYRTAKSIPAEPAIEGDLVYFGSWSRSLYAFNKWTGEVVWKQSGISLDSGTLIAYRGKVYVPHHDNIFMSFDGWTGELLSQGNQDEEAKGTYSNFNATPAFHNGRAFFTARSGRGLVGVPVHTRIYCLDPETAEIYWTYPDGGGLSAPAVANGRVYIASSTSPFFYCLDEKTGAPQWIYRLGHRVEESTLCIYRDRVYALAADGYLHAIE